MRFLLILCLSLFCGSAYAGAYLGITVDSPTERSIMIAYKEAGKDNLIRTDLKSNNQSNPYIDIQEAVFAELRYGKEIIHIYLKPGDDLKIKFLAGAANSTLEFNGKGAENNRLIAEANNRFKSGGYYDYEVSYLNAKILYSYYDKAQHMSPREYFGLVQQKSEEAKQLISESWSKGSIDEEVLAYVSDDLKYTLETQKLGYLIINRKKLAPGDFKRLASHYGTPSPLGTGTDHLVDHPAYFNFAHAYAHWLFLPGDAESLGVELEYYNQIERGMTGKTKYMMLSRLILKVYEFENTTDLAAKKFNNLKKECPYPEYIEPIKELYAGDLVDIPESDAPNFKVIDENGNYGNLSDYKGQVVYISFWAHWCKPCINNFEKSASMRAQLKKMGVVLLNVTIDLDENVWKNAMSKHTIYGTNVMAYDVDGVKKLYGISTLPAYFIVDKRGKFAYLSDEENRDIMQEFRDLVNK